MVTRLRPISILYIIFREHQIFQDSCQNIKPHLINACIETSQFPVHIRKKKVLDIRLNVYLHMQLLKLIN